MWIDLCTVNDRCSAQNTYIGEDWWQHGSSWFDIDVKGKGRYDQTFHTRMTGDVIRITVLNHFFPSEYQVRAIFAFNEPF